MKIFKNSLTKIFALAGLGLLGAQPAHAVIGASVKGGVNLSKITVSAGSASASTSARLGYMGGLGLDFGVGPVGLIADVLYASRSYAEASSASSLQLPLQLRLSLAPMVSLTAGGYYEKSLEDGGADDYGAIGGLRVNLPVVYVEGRYAYGLKKRQVLTAEANTSSMDFLLGLKF
jgi:hypothetical protein